MDEGLKEIPGSGLSLMNWFTGNGFVHPNHEGMITKLGVRLDERGNVKLIRTTIKQIFPSYLQQATCVVVSLVV